MVCNEIKRYDNDRFWSEYISDWEGYDKKHHCPFARIKGSHKNDDKDKSFIVYSNGTFKCFSSSCNEHGDMINFYSLYHSISNGTAIKELAKIYIKPVTLNNDSSRFYIDSFKELLENKEIKNRLENERCITEGTIYSYKIGYKNKRLIIPILQDGNLVNINKHDIFKDLRKDGQRKSLWEKGAEITPFPYANLKKDNIILCAGIPDTLSSLSVLESTKYNPLSFGGESAFPVKYHKSFENKNIYILFDNDSAGRNGTKIIAEKIKNAKSIKSIELGTDDKDICDFLLNLNKTERKEKFLRLIENSKEIEIDTDSIEDKTEEVEFDLLDNISLFNKKVCVYITIIGVGSHPFICPVKIKAECAITNSKECAKCEMSVNDGRLERDLTEKEIVGFIDINKPKREKEVKSLININKKCPSFVNISIEEGTVFEVSFAEKIGSNTTNKDYKNGFVINYKPKVNDIYKTNIVPVVMPKSQQLTYMISNMRPQESILETFELSKTDIDTINNLFIDKLSVEDKIEFMADELEQGVVKRWNRKDNIIASNLSIFSCCEFNFNNSEGRLCRGWVELLMLGDSGTAKSDTVEALFKHYKVGHVVVGEHVTPAGLIGSLMSLGTGSKCFIWGAIPTNDRRIIFIDEVHGKDCVETVKTLTSIRSSGIANKTIQGGTRQTTARCRMIFAANSSRKMGEEVNPVSFIKEIFSEQEDRARLDLILCLSNSEVSLEDIHKIQKGSRDCLFTSHICNALVTWVWSRKPEQILFLDIDYIMQKSKEMIHLYGDTDIEIIHETRYPVKLARISIAVAAMCFSTDNENKNIIVKNEHVDYAILFQKKIYNKRMCGYDDYAKSKNSQYRNKIIHDDGFVEMFRNIKDISSLLSISFFSSDELEPCFPNKPLMAKEFIDKGKRAGYFKKYKNQFTKTNKMTDLIIISKDKEWFKC